MTPEQSAQLARLMEEHVATRPAEVAVATLNAAGERVRVVACWNGAEIFAEYRATLPAADVPALGSGR